MIELNNNQKIIAAIILTVILLVIGYYVWNITQGNETNEINEFISEEKLENISAEYETENTEIVIHIAGAVEEDGIKKLPENSRIADAIEAAGGLTSDANINNVNLAQKIVDGQKIYIPFINEEESPKKEQIIIDPENLNANLVEDDIININTATQTELEMLPGIGTSTAMKIINYRKENGKFKQIEDIQNVPGIGESKYENIKNMITI